MTQMKQIMSKAALAAILAVSLNASADVKTGAYVGLNVGYANLNSNAKVGDTLNDGAGSNGNFTLTKKKGEMQANLLIGYEWMRPSNLILGTELTFGTTFSNLTYNYGADPAPVTDFRQEKIKQQWKTGLYGLVGTPVSDRVSIYGKLGLLYSRFGTAHGSIPGQSGAPAPQIRKQANFFGIEPGVRVKLAMSDAWAATLDASYAWYQTKSETTFTTAAPDTQSLKYAPRMWGVTAGLAYKF